MKDTNQYFKNAARKLAKQTWAGPGKFGVLIFLCILVIATFESLGLSNREINIERRSIPNVILKSPHRDMNDITCSITNTSTNSNSKDLHEKIRNSSEADFNRKIENREKLLLIAAFQNSNSESDTEIRKDSIEEPHESRENIAGFVNSYNFDVESRKSKEYYNMIYRNNLDSELLI